ncbi:MAG: hypothetical protein ACHBMF_11030 [Chromatiales bacterium]
MGNANNKHHSFGVLPRAMGMLTVLYASGKEYLIFFGSPLDSKNEAR